MPQLRAGQHPLDRGQAARGVLGVLSGSSARRGEAHLWLLLEEALTSIRRGGASVDEVRRNVHAVTGALAAAEVVPPGVARRIEGEFGNLLAVRGLTPLAGFLAHDPDPVSEAVTVVAPGPAVQAPHDGARIWLEAEIGRHLDLLAAFDPATRPSAGTEAMRILAGPVRAFLAARALDRPGRALVDDFAASLVDVGYEVRRPSSTTAGSGKEREGRPRAEWAAYLRQELAPPSDEFEADVTHPLDVNLGEVRPGLSVHLTRVAWTPEALEIIARIRHVGLDLAAGTLPVQVALDLDASWSCRMTDELGALHLGQPTRARFDGGRATRFRLRPGLPDGATTFELVIAVGGRQVAATVEV